MENQQSSSEICGTIGDVSEALYELRDALVELSLALRDWQFEADLEQRKAAENTVRQLLQKVTASRDPSQSGDGRWGASWHNGGGH